MLEQMLSRYDVSDPIRRQHALREVMQEIALAGLFRGGFFDQAAFYGGTCLRIFYGLTRFSEDLDFSLLKEDANFSFEPFFDAIYDEFRAMGMDITLTSVHKAAKTQIESAFLKNNTHLLELQTGPAKNIRIKFEVDTTPPLGFRTEEKLLLEPFSFYVKCFQLPDLFAGKMHALLFRQWKNRVKGRDWFDFEWYIRRRVPLHLHHFVERALQTKDIDGSLTPADFLARLQTRIQTVDFAQARLDIERFVPDATVLDVWTPQYFLELSRRLVFSE